MDLRRVQDDFRATGDADPDKHRDCLHRDLQILVIGLEGADAPLNLHGYLSFLAGLLGYREGCGGRTVQVPVKVNIERESTGVRGHL
jgi:hypothetical protein